MDELFVYDENRGLFKEILKQSNVMEGRYHVTTNNGQDLNANNLGTVVATVVQKKYPLCVCVAPKSVINTINGQQREDFYFNLLFLCKSYNAANGTDQHTRKASHDIPWDWKDMKECAANFILMLDTVLRTRRINGVPIAALFNIDAENITVRRLTKFTEDNTSGVWISFKGDLLGEICEIKDYSSTAAQDIIIPPLTIHQAHKHG